MDLSTLTPEMIEDMDHEAWDAVLEIAYESLRNHPIASELPRSFESLMLMVLESFTDTMSTVTEEESKVIVLDFIQRAAQAQKAIQDEIR